MSTATVDPSLASVTTTTDAVARKRARLVRDGQDAADRIVARVCAESTGPGHLLTLLGEAEKRVADGPAPQVFKDAFRERVIALSDGPVY